MNPASEFVELKTYKATTTRKTKSIDKPAEYEAKQDDVHQMDMHNEEQYTGVQSMIKGFVKLIYCQSPITQSGKTKHIAKSLLAN